MTTKRKRTMIPPAYTRICTAPTNSACWRMKMHATSRNDVSRKRAEWTGFFATTTAIADRSARTAKTTKSQPAVPVRSAPVMPLSPLHDGERLDVLGLAPVRQLADVEVEGLVALVGRHL